MKFPPDLVVLTFPARMTGEGYRHIMTAEGY